MYKLTLSYCRLIQEPDISIVSSIFCHILLSINIRFFVRAVPEWNSLPEACVNADTVTALQTQLRHTP